jgi:hypothetical protein
VGGWEWVRAPEERLELGLEACWSSEPSDAESMVYIDLSCHLPEEDGSKLQPGEVRVGLPVRGHSGEPRVWSLSVCVIPLGQWARSWYDALLGLAQVIGTRTSLNFVLPGNFSLGPKCTLANV